jgi:hypothetical protein
VSSKNRSVIQSGLEEMRAVWITIVQEVVVNNWELVGIYQLKTGIRRFYAWLCGRIRTRGRYCLMRIDYWFKPE